MAWPGTVTVAANSASSPAGWLHRIPGRRGFDEREPGRLVSLFASDWVRRYAEEKNPGISFKPMG